MKGREKEKEKLLKFLNGKDKACLVYGLRRIGKSYLIQNSLALSGRKFLYYECVEASLETNLRLFCSSFGIRPLLPYATFLDAFRELGRIAGEMVVVIDEYQNLGHRESDADIDSLMQIAIDQAPAGMKIILCGSYVTAIRKLLDEENPLFGRFNPIIHLEAMDYLDSSLFYPDLEIREKIYDEFAEFIFKEISSADRQGIYHPYKEFGDKRRDYMYPVLYGDFSLSFKFLLKKRGRRRVERRITRV